MADQATGQMLERDKTVSANETQRLLQELADEWSNLPKMTNAMKREFTENTLPLWLREIGSIVDQKSRELEDALYAYRLESIAETSKPLEAHMAEAGASAPKIEAEPAENVVAVGDLRIVLDEMQVYRDGRKIGLSDESRRFMRVLAERKGGVVTYQELADAIEYTRGNPSRGIIHRFKRLRLNLDDDVNDPKYIENVSGGYRLKMGEYEPETKRAAGSEEEPTTDEDEISDGLKELYEDADKLEEETEGDLSETTSKRDGPTEYQRRTSDELRELDESALGIETRGDDENGSIDFSVGKYSAGTEERTVKYLDLRTVLLARRKTTILEPTAVKRRIRTAVRQQPKVQTERIEQMQSQIVRREGGIVRSRNPYGTTVDEWTAIELTMEGHTPNEMDVVLRDRMYAKHSRSSVARTEALKKMGVCGKEGIDPVNAAVIEYRRLWPFQTYVPFRPKLSVNERKVLEMLAEGYTTNRIKIESYKRSISPRILSRLRGKFGVKDNATLKLLLYYLTIRDLEEAGEELPESRGPWRFIQDDKPRGRKKVSSTSAAPSHVSFFGEMRLGNSRVYQDHTGAISLPDFDGGRVSTEKIMDGEPVRSRITGLNGIQVPEMRRVMMSVPYWSGYVIRKPNGGRVMKAYLPELVSYEPRFAREIERLAREDSTPKLARSVRIMTIIYRELKDTGVGAEWGDVRDDVYKFAMSELKQPTYISGLLGEIHRNNAGGRKALEYIERINLIQSLRKPIKSLMNRLISVNSTN